MGDFVDGEVPATPEWTSMELQTRDARVFHSAVFLLEELATKANEVSHPAIPSLGADFLRLVDEVAKWQKETASKN